MTVPAKINAQPLTSPFDQARQVDAQGREYWSARQMKEKPYLNYPRWETLEGVIERARAACQNVGIDPSDQFRAGAKLIEHGKGGKREIDDVYLSRYACYLVAMNGDPIKPEIAAAQNYFVQQTRRAELGVHPDSLAKVLKEIEELKAENASIRDEQVRLRKGVHLGIIGPDCEAPADWFPVNPWLKDRGIVFKSLGEKSKAGTDVKDIAVRMGKTPEKYRYKGKGKPRNHYPLAALEKYLAVYLRTNPVYRFPSLFGVVDNEPTTRRAKKSS